jgi:uncharacterized protein
MIAAAPRRSTPEELDAFDRVCARLAGFDESLSYEWIDGFLCALAAGPRVPPASEWLDPMCGETFGRVFGDPEDVGQALSALQARLKVLCHQLDPEALLDDPDRLRLDPLIGEWTDADRQELVDQVGMSTEDAAAVQTGAEWATGFLDAVESLPAVWALPADEEAAQAFGPPLDQVAALILPPASVELEAHLAEYYPGESPPRDELLGEALMAVQELRTIWVDFAPRPETRRVDPRPGRNDPCPCGSGKKFKKCHGAAAG